MKRLAIITTHPIQYNAPLFRLLAHRRKIKIKVFYTWGESVLKNKYDPGFGKVIEWDIPLLNGYEYQFVENASTKPGSHHFNGIINPTIVRDIESWKANAVLVYGWSFRSHLQCLRYFYKKIPVYFRGDSILLNKSGGILLKCFKNILLKWIYSHVDRAFYVGSSNKDYFLEYGLMESKLVFAPHAIENERFEKSFKTDFREQLNIDNSEIVFLFAGKLEWVKNPDLLLDAFIKLDARDSYLVFVGNGNLENDLKFKVSNLEISTKNRIKFIDFQNQTIMPDIYKMADVVVLPSRSETWGLAINEAMASGRAVLVSDKCGCARDLVIEGVTGYCFESGNEIDLVIKMKKMLDKYLLKKMGIAGKAMIDDWSLDKVAKAIESLLIQSSSFKSFYN